MHTAKTRASPTHSPSELPPPTLQASGEMQFAFDFFNQELFSGELPDCLITLQRSRYALGFFMGDRFGCIDGKIADEIALNPRHFKHRTFEEVTSTLVHEMAHHWQHHFGKP